MAEVLHCSATAIFTARSRLPVLESPSCVKLAAPWKSQFWGISKQLSVRQQQQQLQHQHCLRLQSRRPASLQVINTAPWLRWWEKDGAPNMIDIHSMQEFIDALTDAGDRLVIVEFYSRSCTGCRSLYPKLCKIAKEHPHVLFLKINFEENTEICKALNVRVLPLFFVYRAQGHLESFSCTISKIKRLKDAIAKYSNTGERSPAGIAAATVNSVGNMLGDLKEAAAGAAGAAKQPANAGSDFKDAIPV